MIQTATRSGNVKKCAVGKHPKSEKHGNTAQFSEVERIVTVHMLLPRSAYEEMRQLLSEHRLSKADILMAGIAACSNQKVG